MAASPKADPVKDMVKSPGFTRLDQFAGGNEGRLKPFTRAPEGV